MSAPQSPAEATQAPATPADPLALYGVILAVTTLVHRTVIPNWITVLKVPTGWLTVVAAIWLLFRPGSTRAFTFFVLAALAEWLRLLPFMPNHFFFEGLMNVTVLCALVRRWRRDRAGGAIDRARLLDDFAPIVRAELLVLYAFTVLHKLNTSFLDPQVSCAVKMHRELAEFLPFLPAGPAMDVPIIAMTLAFEAGIPLLLAFRRTVYWGIGAGLFFHALLGIHPHAGVSSFSAMLYALYFLFLPPEAVTALAAFWERSRQAWRKVLPSISPKAVVVIVFVLTLLAQTWLALANVWYRTLVTEATRIAFWPGAAWCSWLALSYLSAMQAKVAGGRGSTLRLSPHPGWAVLPLLVFNGFCPYLGLKTVTVFSMFSNLRTESAPNHLFMPQLHLTRLQTDQVRIVSSSHQGTASECESIAGGMWCSFPGERVPYFEFRRWTHEMRDHDGKRLRVSFERAGRRYELAPDSGGDDALRAELYAPPPWLLSRVVALRLVQEPSGPTTCRW